MTTSTDTTDYLIDIDDVTVSYPDDTQPNGCKVVLNEVKLQVSPGEFVTVVGPSGCGKSTLLRLVLGSQFANQGTTYVDGKPVDRVSSDRGIVYQKYSLFPNLSVVDNIAVGPILRDTSIAGRILHLPQYYRERRKHREEAREMIETIGLAKTDADKYPYELSGGMRQRVAIAQSAIMRPKILLMDEPFGALDHSTRAAMQNFILELWEREKMTIFFVTHELAEAAYLGSRIIGLSQFYRGDCGTMGPNLGAKIVADRKAIGSHPKPSTFKDSPEFQQLLHDLEKQVLDPDHLQHIREFDHDHEDAFRNRSGADA